MPDLNTTATFKADISSLRSEMQAASRAVKLANSEFKAASAGMDDWGSSADGLEAKIKQLGSVLKAQNKQVELAAQELEKTEQAYGENSAEADRARIRYNNFKAAAAKTEKELHQYEDQLEDVGNATEEVEEATEDATDGFTVMKGVLADLAASAIKAGIQGLKDLGDAAMDAYKDFDEGYDNVIKATGATGESAEQLEQSFKNVTKSVLGDFGDIGSALGEVNTRFGFTGDELENATETFVKFADITGTDATNAVRLVSRAMGDAGIDAEDYAELLDTLAVASQASGISIDSLTENLTKYGAPMRALGFDTKESIAIFSQWEKAGVNTEIAFSGMKTAIANWSAEGKDAREEFADTLEKIAEAPDIAEATSLAIEAFGKKAGPDLADAIQNGRFEYQDFLNLLEGSAGAVENTYEQTQDGFDKIQLAIQGARSEVGDFIADLFEEHEGEIISFIDDAVEKLENFLTWISENKETVKTGLAVIGGAIGTAFVVTKVTNFISALGRLKGAIGGVKTAAGKLAENGSLLSGALANPVATGLVGGFALLAGAVVYADNQIEKSIKSQHSLTEEQQALVDKCAAVKTAYDENTASRKGYFGTITTESSRLRNLVTEYNELVTENGKVKSGYEERANFIIGELAQSMGVEREEIEKNIGENGKLKDSILDIIETQRAQAMLDVGRESYTEAYQQRGEALKSYQEALGELDKASADYTQTQKDLAAAQENYNTIANTYPEGMMQAENELNKARIANDAAKESFETMQQAVADAGEAYSGFNSVIQNYEGLGAAVASGDMEKIGEAALKMEYNFQTAETGTEESLKKQSENLKQAVADMQKAVDSGMPGVTQDMVDALKSLSTQADTELAKVSGVGKGWMSELSKQITGRKSEVGKAVKDVADAAVKGAETGLAQMKPTGAKGGGELADGVASKTGESEKAGDELGTAAKDGAELVLAGFGSVGKLSGEEYLTSLASKKSDSKKAGTTVANAAKDGTKTAINGFKTNGTTSGKNYAKGVSGTQSDATTAGNVIGTAAKDGTELVLVGMTNSGSVAGSNYNSGISSQNGAANTAGSNLAANAKSGTEGADTYSSGVNFAQGFINGIGSLVQSAANKAREMVRAAINSAKAAQQEGSPSKLTYQSGVFFTQGYILGIASQEKELVKTVRGMVSNVVGELAKMTAYNFDTVGKNAGNIFADRMKKDISYMTAKMSYQNEQKIAEFDAEVERLEKERDKSIADLESGGDSSVKKLEAQLKKEQESLKKTKTQLNNKTKAETKALQADLDKALKQAKTASEKRQNAIQSQIDATSDKEAKKRLQQQKKDEQNALKAVQDQIKASYKAEMDAVKKVNDNLYAAREKASKKEEKRINKEIESAKKSNEELVEAEKNRYEELINTQKKYQNAYQTASGRMLSELEDAMQAYQDQAQALIDDTIKGITDKYSDRYDDLIDKQNNLISKLKNAGELFTVSGAGVMRIQDIQAQTQQIREYTERLQKIKDKVSSELFDEITTYDMKEGSAFLGQLLAMSESDLTAYNKAYTEKMEAVRQAGDSIYKSDFEQVAKDYKAEIGQAFKDLPATLEQLGYQSLKGFMNGLTTNTDYMSEEIKTFVKGMVDQFKDQLGIRSPSKVMYEIGEYTGEGFNDGLMSMLGYVKSTVSEMTSLISQPLNFDPGSVRGAVNQGGYGAMVGGVVNNYNLVQNNTSPKALSALETYQARRQQIALVKAFA